MNIKYPVSAALGHEMKIPIGNKPTKVYFEDIPEVRGKKIRYIDVFSAIGAKAMSGRTLHRPSDSYLTLSDGRKEFVSQILIYQNFDVSGNSSRRILIDKVLDMPNSFVDFEGFVDDNESLFFIFWYDNGMQLGDNYHLYGKRDVEAIELVPSENFQRVYFPDNNNLNNRFLRNVIAYITNGVPVTSPNGLPFVSDDLINNCYLTLKKGNYEVIKNVPLGLFVQSDAYYCLSMKDVEIDPTSCYLDIANISLINPNESIFLNIEMQAL